MLDHLCASIITVCVDVCAGACLDFIGIRHGCPEHCSSCSWCPSCCRAAHSDDEYGEAHDDASTSSEEVNERAPLLMHEATATTSTQPTQTPSMSASSNG